MSRINSAIHASPYFSSAPSFLAHHIEIQVSSFALCGAFAVGVVCACVVALFLFLNHTFDTSNAKRVKGAKIVAVTGILFNGVALIVMASVYLMIIEQLFLLFTSRGVNMVLNNA